MDAYAFLQEQSRGRLLAAISETAAGLMLLLLPLSEEQINTIPFKNSWTAAQLAIHITKSNHGMAQALAMEGKPALRKPDARVGQLKNTFLNYGITMKSPAFIEPAAGFYKKDYVVTALKKSNERLKEHAMVANLNDMINLPAAFGEITKLELFHFVIYHTQRHIAQLKNILKHL